MTTPFNKITQYTQSNVVSSILAYKKLSENLSGMTQNVLARTGYFHHSSQHLMKNDIAHTFASHAPTPFTVAMNEFLNIHNYGTRIWAAYINLERLDDGFLTKEAEILKQISNSLGYENNIQNASELKKMALSPLMSIVPSLMLHYETIGLGRKNGIHAQQKLESFDGWSSVCADSLESVFRQVTREQRIGPHGAFRVNAIPSEQAKITFATLGVDMAYLHLSRTPLTILAQQEAVKLLRAAWSIDDITAQKHVIEQDDLYLTSFTRNACPGWDVTDSKQKFAAELRSEKDASDALAPKKIRHSF